MKKRGAFVFALVYALVFAFVGIIFLTFAPTFVYAVNSGTTYSNFFTGGVQCIKTADTAIWKNTTDGQTFDIPPFSCRLFTSTYGEDCCPSENNICLDDGTCSGLGRVCNDFASELACNGTGDDIARTTLGSTLSQYCGQGYTDSSGCEYGVLCNCKWFVDSEAIGSCNITVINYTLVPNSCDSGSGSPGGGNNPAPGDPQSGRCEILSSIQDNCNTAVPNMISRQIATWIGDGLVINCEDKTVPLSCASTVQLSFIGNFGIILGICIVALAYVVHAFYSSISGLKRKKLSRTNKVYK